MIAISVDPAEATRERLGAERFAFPLLADPDLKVIDAYGLRHPGAGPGGDIARPAIFLVGPEGRIEWRELTDNWRVRVRPQTVLERLTAASAAG